MNKKWFRISVTRFFVQYLAIYNDEILPNSKTIGKEGSNYANY